MLLALPSGTALAAVSKFASSCALLTLPGPYHLGASENAVLAHRCWKTTALHTAQKSYYNHTV